MSKVSNQEVTIEIDKNTRLSDFRSEGRSVHVQDYGPSRELRFIPPATFLLDNKQSINVRVMAPQEHGLKIVNCCKKRQVFDVPRGKCGILGIDPGEYALAIFPTADEGEELPTPQPPVIMVFDNNKYPQYANKE